MKEPLSNIFNVFCISMLNQPYRWGGDDPIKGFDCSGLVLEWLKWIGVVTRKDPDMNAQALYEFLRSSPFNSSLNSITKGTILFFGDPTSKISHVGIAISKYLFIEAGSGDSSTTTLDRAAEQNAYVRIRPIKSRKDLKGYLSLDYDNIEI